MGNLSYPRLGNTIPIFICDAETEFPATVNENYMNEAAWAPQEVKNLWALVWNSTQDLTENTPEETRGTHDNNVPGVHLLQEQQARK